MLCDSQEPYFLLSMLILLSHERTQKTKSPNIILNPNTTLNSRRKALKKTNKIESGSADHDLSVKLAMVHGNPIFFP